MIDIVEYNDYRSFLNDMFEFRRSKDSHLSMRKFAKQVGLSSTTLSDLLRQKASLSLDRASVLAEQLGLNDPDSARFCDLVQSIDGKSESLRRMAKQRLSSPPPTEHLRLADTVFQVVSDWHHYAILQLFDLDDFKNDILWMAKRLHLAPIAVSNALNRLERIGLVSVENGEFTPINIRLQTKIDQPSKAVRKHQRQLIERALVSLDNDSVNDRNFTSMLFPGDPSKLKEIKIKLNEAIEKIVATMGDGKKTSLFSLNTQLFKI